MPDTEDKISALYDKSKSQLEPPEHLDAAIRTAARKAQRARYRRIYPAMGLAATLVLGVGVVWLQMGVSPELAEPVSTQSTPAASLAAPSPQAPEAAQFYRELASDAAPSMEAASALQRFKLEETDALPSSNLSSETSVEAAQAQKSAPPREQCAAGMEDADRKTWKMAIEEAAEAGDDSLVLCLKREFREQFFEQNSVNE